MFTGFDVPLSPSSFPETGGAPSGIGQFPDIEFDFAADAHDGFRVEAEQIPDIPDVADASEPEAVPDGATADLREALDSSFFAGSLVVEETASETTSPLPSDTAAPDLEGASAAGPIPEVPYQFSEQRRGEVGAPDDPISPETTDEHNATESLAAARVAVEVAMVEPIAEPDLEERGTDTTDQTPDEPNPSQEPPEPPATPLETSSQAHTDGRDQEVVSTAATPAADGSGGNELPPELPRTGGDEPGEGDGPADQPEQKPVENIEGEARPEIVDVCNLRDHKGVVEMRRRLMDGEEAEGQNAAQIVAELEANYVDNVRQGADRHIVLTRSLTGELRIRYISYGEVITEKSFNRVKDNLQGTNLKDRLLYGRVREGQSAAADAADAERQVAARNAAAPEEETEWKLLQSTGRGSALSIVFSKERGIQRLTNKQGNNLGVELWFDVKQDEVAPPPVISLDDLEGDLEPE